MTWRASAAGIIASITTMSHAQKAGSRNGPRDSRRRGALAGALDRPFISRFDRLVDEPRTCAYDVMTFILGLRLWTRNRNPRWTANRVVVTMRPSS